MASGASVTAANGEYDKMNDPAVPLPTPPVHAARLSQLLKALANAESSVSEVIKSRLALIDGLEKLLETNRAALSKEQSVLSQLTERKAETEAKKRDVEDSIMRGLSIDNPSLPQPSDAGAEAPAVARPEVEALTPPPVEAITPVGSPTQAPQEKIQESVEEGQVDGFLLPGIGQPTNNVPSDTGLPGLSSLSGMLQQGSPNGVNSKKRKVTHGEEDYAQYASGDLDADVAELLNQEGYPQER